MKKTDLDPICLIEEKQEGAGAIVWAVAAILVLGIALGCFIVTGFCR
jgi:hypothetical protein